MIYNKRASLKSANPRRRAKTFAQPDIANLGPTISSSSTTSRSAVSCASMTLSPAPGVRQCRKVHCRNGRWPDRVGRAASLVDHDVGAHGGATCPIGLKALPLQFRCDHRPCHVVADREGGEEFDRRRFGLPAARLQPPAACLLMASSEPVGHGCNVVRPL